MALLNSYETSNSSYFCIFLFLAHRGACKTSLTKDGTCAPVLEAKF